MNGNLEFVRGNQKSFIRLPLEEHILQGHEMAMCTNNTIRGLLAFQRRAHNGQEYLYFDVTGTQSLDILLEMQKLTRTFMIMLAKSIIKLCHHISEYMLSLESVVLEPKYMMYKAFEDEIQFVYTFQTGEKLLHHLEKLLEYCIDHLDYEDKLLTEEVFQLYENLQDQGCNFSLEKEMERLLEHLEENVSDKKDEVVINSMEAPVTEKKQPEPLSSIEEYQVHSYKKWKRYLICFFVATIIGIFVWKPLTILKLFFFASFGIFLVGMYFYISYLEKRQQDGGDGEKSQRDITYIQEYQSMVAQSNATEDGTQFISIENITGMLYNLQGLSPQYISITETPQLIGKDASKVQISLLSDTVSRVHAKIVKSGDNYLLEDLCSTNGTWVNGKSIEPRVPYTLKTGDKVSFASHEYIFR